MICAGVDKIRKTELFNVAEALEYRRIQQGECKILYLDIAMDRVFDDLHRCTKRIFIYIA
jgi:hypothetical protein